MNPSGPVQSRTEIFDRLRQHRSDLQRLGLTRCGLFGSSLHGAQHPDSDVNVLVDFVPGQKSFSR